LVQARFPAALVPVGVGAGVGVDVSVGVGVDVSVGVGVGMGMVGVGVALVGVGVGVVGVGAGEEDTLTGMGLFGVGTAEQAVSADAAPIAARTVQARDNLSIGKQPFWRAPGRIRYAHYGGRFRRFISYAGGSWCAGL